MVRLLVQVIFTIRLYCGTPVRICDDFDQQEQRSFLKELFSFKLTSSSRWKSSQIYTGALRQSPAYYAETIWLSASRSPGPSDWQPLGLGNLRRRLFISRIFMYHFFEIALLLLTFESRRNGYILSMYWSVTLPNPCVWSIQVDCVGVTAAFIETATLHLLSVHWNMDAHCVQLRPCGPLFLYTPTCLHTTFFF